MCANLKRDTHHRMPAFDRTSFTANCRDVVKQNMRTVAAELTPTLTNRQRHEVTTEHATKTSKHSVQKNHSLRSLELYNFQHYGTSEGISVNFIHASVKKKCCLGEEAYQLQAPDMHKLDRQQSVEVPPESQ